jgi:sugar phosphate isomerase/epimerase
VTWRTCIATSAAPTGFGPLLFAGRVDEAARVAADLRLDGIEVSLRSPGELDGVELRRLLDGHGLQLAAVASGRAYLEDGLSLSAASGGERRRAVERVRELVAYGADFGAPLIVGLLRGREVPSPEVLARLEASVAACADAAADCGVPLLLEAINRYETPLLNTALETVAFVRRLQRPNLRILLDVFHMNIEEVSLADAVLATGALLGHFHIVDSNRRAPGMGHVDYQPITAALLDVGYEGWLSAEVLPLPDDAAAARQVRTFVRGLRTSSAK